jgi:preprotein translocase subunit SecE
VDNDYLKLGIAVAVVGVIFIVLWRKGLLLRFSNYVQETKEELRKCTWPTWDELKGSTTVVMISIILLGAFTVIIDQVLFHLVHWMIQI